MNVVILLAGYGTRLRPHTYTRPKPLITVAGKPVIEKLVRVSTPLAASMTINAESTAVSVR